MGGAATRNQSKSGKVNRRVLGDIVRRIVAAAQPEKIILFGSAARGEMGLDSDIGLLVVKAGNFDRDRLTGRIYDHLSGAESLPAASDRNIR